MSGVQSIDRALNLLEIISKYKNGISITSLSEETKLHKSTVHRLVSSLVFHGYVTQLDDAKYKLSYKLYRLGVNAFSDLSLVDVARDNIIKLSREVGEVVHLVIRNKNEVIYIDKENPSRSSSIMGSRIGSSAPIYCTSVGKAMLFDSNDYEIMNIWESIKIDSKTHKTITDFERFKKEIEYSKKLGYAIDDEENEIGISCIGAPIYDYTNKIIAAISLSGPIIRVNKMNLEKYVQPLIREAKDISKKLGYIEK